MSAPSDWWRTFFSGPTVEWWLRAVPEDFTKAEALFVESALDLRPGAKVLDVPCGGGRHALALAARGHKLTAVDISEEFLVVAQTLCYERELKIDWREGDMRDLPWNGEFDGAYCMGNSFGYLLDDENAAFLQAVSRTLRPGARFVLDTGYIAECLFPTLQERAWYPDGENHVLASRRYEPVDARLHVAYTFVSKTRQSTSVMSARIYTCHEVVELLKDAGFGAIELLGSISREPFRLGSQRLLIVATKS